MQDPSRKIEYESKPGVEREPPNWWVLIAAFAVAGLAGLILAALTFIG